MSDAIGNLMSPDVAVPPMCDPRVGSEIVEGLSEDILRDKTVKVIRVGKSGANLFITVLGPDMDSVSSGSARAIAYEERLKHGFENAGIEHAGIMFSVDLSLIAKEGVKGIDQIPRDRIQAISPKDMGFCALYKLTRGI